MPASSFNITSQPPQPFPIASIAAPPPLRQSPRPLRAWPHPPTTAGPHVAHAATAAPPQSPRAPPHSCTAPSTAPPALPQPPQRSPHALSASLGLIGQSLGPQGQPLPMLSNTPPRQATLPPRQSSAPTTHVATAPSAQLVNPSTHPSGEQFPSPRPQHKPSQLGRNPQRPRQPKSAQILPQAPCHSKLPTKWPKLTPLSKLDAARLAGVRLESA